MIDCCIFDLDGVVVDTARYHYLAWAALARELGLEFTPVQGEATKGVSRMGAPELVRRARRLEGRFSAAERERLAAEKNARYLRFVSQMTPAEVLPGVAAFLHDVRSRGVRTVLGSASKNAGTILDRCGLRPLFDAVVDGNEVSRAKPDPEVFLKGAAAGCVRSAVYTLCLCMRVRYRVPAGIASRAGLRSVGVGGGASLSAATMRLETFAGFTFEQLAMKIDRD